MFSLVFCLMISMCFLITSQSNLVIASLISLLETLGCRGFLWQPYVFNGAGNELWCSKSFSSSLQLSDKISLSVICFGLLVPTQWVNAESMEFTTMRQTALERKAIIWHFTYCMLLTGHWHLQFLAGERKSEYLNGVYIEVFQTLSLDKSFH